MAVQSRRRIQFFPLWGEKGQAGPSPDYVLLVIVGALILVGLISIYSVSFGPNLQSGDNPLKMIGMHIGWLIAGLVLMIITAAIDYHFLQRIAVPLLAASLASLVLVLIVGVEQEGAKRWLFGSSIQPSEPAKIITVIYIAAWATSKGKKLRHLLYGLVPFGILVGLVFGLIAMEPNLSTAMLIAITAGAMFFVAGADVIQFVLAMVIGGITAAGVILRSSYAMGRISFIVQDVFKLPDAKVWQLKQSLLALAGGGLIGQGLGTGGGQYGYVPLAHSDGIFAIWGEETGIVGTWLLVAIILALTYRGFRIALKAPDDFGRVLAAGITFWLTFQAFVNIGVVTQLMPLTGQPLPFISYGGSALITELIGIGLLLSVSRGKALPQVVKKVAAPARAADEKEKDATVDDGWRNRRARIPAVGGAPKPRRRPRSRTLD